jgi:hypothetical protein
MLGCEILKKEKFIQLLQLSRVPPKKTNKIASDLIFMALLMMKNEIVLIGCVKSILDLRIQITLL